MEVFRGAQLGGTLRVGAFSFVARLSNVIIDHASLSRQSRAGGEGCYLSCMAVVVRP